MHSLTYFYNWSFAHVRTSYSMKWDGDMVLTAEGVELLRDLSWQLEDSNAVVAIPRHPMSVESESVAWLDLGYRFLEPWVYPMGPEFTFVKAFEWEVREFPPTSERIVAPEGMCVELKWLDQDEFAHWSDTAFDAVRTPRKARELEVNRALHEGRGHEIEGLKRIEAPAGVHVVDYVTKHLDAARAAAADAPARAAGDGSLMGPGPALDAFVQEAPEVPGRHRAGRRGRARASTTASPSPSATAASSARCASRGGCARRRWRSGSTRAARALSLTPRPEWPALHLIRSRAVDGGWLTVLRFASSVPVHRVVGRARPAGGLARPRRASAASSWRGGHRQGGAPTPLDVTDPDPMVALGPLDERVLNPIGFERDVDGAVVDLSELDWGRGPTEALVRGLRAGRSAYAPTCRRRRPLLAARVIAGLAMAGVPLVGGPGRPRVAAHLGAEVTAAITTEVDLTDAAAREEHSVVLRRAALTAYSSAAWRRRLGELAGVRVAAQPAVSVVMATRRPDLLEHALGQVGPAARRRPARAGPGSARLRASTRPGSASSPAAAPVAGRPPAGAT